MILIIDSDAPSDLKIRQNFESSGYKSLVLARTAVQAREILGANVVENEKYKDRITLIIINSELEDGSGFSLCREIRNMTEYADTFILVLISSAENKTAIEKARHSGANDFAVKPYDATVFFRYMKNYMLTKTVLLVEDDPLIRQMVCAVLLKYAVEVIEIDNGIEAHNLINSIFPLCLVILDIGLPGMSGVKLVSRIRSKTQWKKTPVVMLTSSTDAADVKGSLSSGANDYIVKPFKIDDFGERMARYLRRV